MIAKTKRRGFTDQNVPTPAIQCQRSGAFFLAQNTILDDSEIVSRRTILDSFAIATIKPPAAHEGTAWVGNREGIGQTQT